MKIIQEYLTINDFADIVIKNEKITIDPSIEKRVQNSFEFLQNFSSNKVIYGVNTGFGPMAQYRIKEADQKQLQYNLIRSHSSGIGNPLSSLHAKAAVMARLHTLALGKSGVNTSVIHLMKEFINRDITPLIFAHGGVGASGDLVQLAHLALNLIGEGEVFYQGQRRSTSEVFAKENLQPIDIQIREGIALMNGTSVMTGIGIVNVLFAQQLIDIMIKNSSLINELVQAYDDHLSEPLNNSKLHKGQQWVAAQMRAHIADSQLTRNRQEHLYSGENTEEIFKEKVQEYYSIRCIPQIIGPIYETVCQVESILEKEINSANDNPIIDVDAQQVYHGGNFHGDYISLEMDKLKLVITKLSILSERQLNYLLNSKINEILPPFVNLGKLGFNFGMQGVQFTATSTTAENQALSTSMYIHSIPNNNDNQDIVSMGTNAAVMCSQVIENTFEIVAIESITLIQAVDALQCYDKLSSASKKWYHDLRAIVPVFTEDQVMYPLVEQVKQFFKKNNS